MPDNFHVRWMIRKDMPEVLQTEWLSFEHAWVEEDFLKCLRQRNCIGMVIEIERTATVIGYMIYLLHKTRLEILNFAVHPDHRRKGAGRKMVEKLVSKLSSHRRVKMDIHVSERNLDAQLFFRQMRFLAVGVDPGWFDTEDGYRMEYQFEEEADETKPVAKRVRQG